MSEDKNLYPVEIQGTREELISLANSGAAPEEPVIFLMTEGQYRQLPGRGRYPQPTGLPAGHRVRAELHGKRRERRPNAG